MASNSNAKHRVREDYRQVLEQAASREGQPLAERLYTPEELAGIPVSAKEAALGLGNPASVAGLQPGQVVLDIGCGAGIDTLLAARRVGPGATVVGIDLTPEMVELARRNAVEAGLTHVETRRGDMEDLGDFADATFDCVLSNGVLSLCRDKERALAEVHRALKPRGTVVLCDLAVEGEVPEEVLANPAAWSG